MGDPRRLQDAYKHHWEKAANDCKMVKAKIEQEFPTIEIRPGHGALSADYEFTEHEKGSADLFLYEDDMCICAIEVTGSDRVNMYPGKDLWIRPDKIEYMRKMKDDFPVFVWLVYPNCQCVLSLPLIDLHKERTITRYLRGPTYPETFVTVKYEHALKPKWLLQFIAMRMKDPPVKYRAVAETVNWSDFW